MIKLYTAPTPNGYKVSCLLEILQIPYEYELVNLLEKEQFSDQFKKISPNSKIPAIEDTKNNFALAESCLLYTSPSPRDRQKSRMPSSA